MDLATGCTVRIRLRRSPTVYAPLFRRGRWYLVDSGSRSPRVFVEAWGRALDAPASDPPAVDAVRSALLDARDGCPRAVDLVAGDLGRWRRVVHDLARDARAEGFVPVDAEVLGEVLRSNRWRWPRWLAERSLLVFTCDGQLSSAATLGLLHLATRDARPHVVVRGATNALGTSGRLIRQPFTVHEGDDEAGWRQGSVEPAANLADQAWRDVEDGRGSDAATATARWAVLLASSDEEEAGARASLVRALAAQGRTIEARASLVPARALPPSLPSEVQVRLAEARRALELAEQPRRGDTARTDDFLQVIELCQATEDEHTTLGRVLALLRDRVAGASLAVLCEENDCLRVIVQTGVPPGDLRVVRRALVSSRSCPPEPGDACREGAWLVRYAGHGIGALYCRWSAGMAIDLAAADALLGLAAVAVAPVVQVVAERGRALAEAPDIPDLVGDSDAMRALRAAVARAARSPFAVLVEGESGSGKELVARAIHQASARRDRRFSALNCAALTDELAEAELFGHARGAFTGAVAERAGMFEDANGGTLFLDEVSELSLRIQAKLLRVLQEQEVRRLGETQVRRIDARIVAASNRPLAGEVDAGRFRRDLRYRLDVIRLTVPPLRERLADLPALVRHVWSSLCTRTGCRATLSPSALAALGRYDWPGNVRELQNVLASLMVSAPPRGTISAAQLPAHVARAATLETGRSLADARREFDVRYVRAALARANGHCGTAARELGVSRQGLAKLMGRLGLAARGPEYPAIARSDLRA